MFRYALLQNICGKSTIVRNFTKPLAISNLSRCSSRKSHDSSSTSPERTALYDFHVAHGGKIVDFGGYLLPVQYADQGIAASHLHTRQFASIFDVSHMLQTYVRGKDAIACMESICTADVAGLLDGSGSLTVFTNDSGCILDDLIVSKVNSELLYVVSNAAMKQQDMVIMEAAVTSFKAQNKDVSIEFLPSSERSLIAVQGSKAISTVSQLVSPQLDLNKLYFMNTVESEVAGVSQCRITRCGYTGEDGCEISVPSSKVRHVTEALLDANPQIKMAGLGARDSLRLEAGLCLYGSDIDAKTTPVEATLSWLIAKRRRTELNFPGAQQICNQLKNDVTRRRIGLHMIGKSTPPARGGVQIYHDSTKVGNITSGCPSPSLGKNIAMGYVAEKLKKPGTRLHLKIRDKLYDAEIVKMPFVPTNYYVKRN